MRASLPPSKPVIPRAILDLPVEGQHLAPGRFGDQFTHAPALLVFPRHFG